MTFAALSALLFSSLLSDVSSMLPLQIAALKTELDAQKLKAKDARSRYKVRGRQRASCRLAIGMQGCASADLLRSDGRCRNLPAAHELVQPCLVLPGGLQATHLPLSGPVVVSLQALDTKMKALLSEELEKLKTVTEQVDPGALLRANAADRGRTPGGERETAFCPAPPRLELSCLYGQQRRPRVGMTFARPC